GLRRWDAASTCGRGAVRPDQGLLRAPSPRVLGKPRSHDPEPAGSRRGRAIPFCDFYAFAGAGGGRPLVEGNARRVGPAPPPDRDRDRGRRSVLPRRGVSPAIPREARPRDLPPPDEVTRLDGFRREPRFADLERQL